jgi:hypothetical protein
MANYNENLTQLLQVLFLTVTSLEHRRVRHKSTLKSIQLVKLKLFHKPVSNTYPDTYLDIIKITKKNVKFKVILKLLFFSSFTDKLDNTNIKRAIINQFTILDLLSTKYILPDTDRGITKDACYINTLTLVSLYTLYKLKYQVNKCNEE